MRIHCFQHVPFEPPARIADWAAERRARVRTTRFYDGDAPPHPDDYDWLVVMGGPMGVRDRASYPWLVTEVDAIERSISAGKTVVGVCLGAQLIASALGSRVYENAEEEVGWFPVTLTEAALRHPLTRGLPETFVALHWHRDTFDLPDGSVLLATSEACRAQMFAVGSNVLGVQFHLEMTSDVIATLSDDAPAGGVDAPFVQRREKILSEFRHLQPGYDILDSILGRL